MTALPDITPAAITPAETVMEPEKIDQQRTGSLEVGLMRLCGRDLAVPALHVREVVPRPDTFHPSFSGRSASVGSIVIRGTVIPILDIRPHLGLSTDNGGQQVVLVLRQNDELVGLLMDSVSGLARIPTSEIQQFRFHDGGDDQLVAKSFTLNDAVVGLLDPAAVFRLPNVPHALEEACDAGHAWGGARRTVVLLTAGGAEIALEADRIAATVPNAVVRPSPVPFSDWIGVVDYLGREVPVVDDLALFGLSGRAGDTGVEPVIIIRIDDQHLIGLRIDRVRRILPIDASAVKPLPAALAERLRLFAGAVADQDGRQSLLLREDAMVMSDSLRVIGELSRKKSVATVQAGSPSQRKAQPQQAFLVFRAGGRNRACAMASVTQIIALPRDHTRLNVPGSALRGMAGFNGSPLPLMDLGGGGERDVDPAQAKVLVVQGENAFTGFVVDRLETIAKSVAQPSPDPGSGDADRRSYFIEALVGGRAEAVTLCDLAEEARRLA